MSFTSCTCLCICVFLPIYYYVSNVFLHIWRTKGFNQVDSEASSRSGVLSLCDSVFIYVSVYIWYKFILCAYLLQCISVVALQVSGKKSLPHRMTSLESMNLWLAFLLDTVTTWELSWSESKLITTVMVGNFMYQLAWATACPDIWGGYVLCQTLFWVYLRSLGD